MTTMFLGHDHFDEQKPVHFDLADLTTHGVVLGQTGSGKTGATATLIEEAVLSGASAIVVDPKGDLTNLALSFPRLTPEEFAPWVPAGQNPAVVADRALRELGSRAAGVATWHDRAEISIYAPGKVQGGGKPVNILPSFDAPRHSPAPAIMRKSAGSLVSAILGAIGHNEDPLTDPANVYLTEVVLDAWRRGKSAGFETWAGLLSTPPETLRKIDGLSLEDFFPKSARMKIARRLIGFRRQADRWLNGEPLDIERFVQKSNAGRGKVSVFTLRHLDEGDRMFFVSMLFSAIVDYMFRAPASNDLRLLVVLDEARGFLPPYPANPPTKKPITTLLAQGRAQGIGLVISTQNPNDMDYKALSNVGTWFLGKLRERDCARDLTAELAERGVDRNVLATIPSRHFLVLKKSGASVVTKIRWAYSYLRGPLNGDELARLESALAARGGESVLDGGSALPVITGAHNFITRVADPNSRPVSARLVYYVEGQGWRHATMRAPAASLHSTPEGIDHTLVWDTKADLGDRRAKVLVCVELNGSVYSEPSELIVDNAQKGFLRRIFG